MYMDHNVVKVSSKMLSFVVLAKKNFGANPIIIIINKPRLIFGHAPLHFASVQQDFSESVILSDSESAVAAAPYERT